MTSMPPRFSAARLPFLWRALPLALAGFLATTAQAAVLISQVYGGGGNTGATLRHDFIEIFNNGDTAVDIGGWSVQYASSTGTTWQRTVITAATVLPPGGYYLIRQAMGTTGGTVDTPADQIGSIPMAGPSGKVVLVNTDTLLTGGQPTSASIVDVVGYGAANFSETAPTALLSNTTAAIRNNGGCTDTGNNATDFSIGTPTPRTRATPVNTNCEAGPPPPPPPVPVPLEIYEIQGSGATSPAVGQRVVTTGTVTKVNNNGFFIQNAAGDGNTATSDGIFVFTSTAPPAAAALGNLVRVTGTVVEFSNGAGTVATPLTEISSVTLVENIGSSGAITPVSVTLPLAVGDSLERYEGMLVSINNTLTVQQNFLQARFGLFTLGLGRQETPTNRFPPGPLAQALASEQARSRILLDDGSSLQNPNPTPYLGANGVPRAGDTVSNLVGVLDFGLPGTDASAAGLYRVQPTAAPVFVASNPRPTAPATVGGNVKLGAMNVLNYFTTFTNGNTAFGETGQGCTVGSSTTAGNCRGANNIAEYERQRDKIVRALAGLDADAVGLIEIQNNGNIAAQALVDAVNTYVGSAAYAVVPAPGNTGSDAIRVAMMYKPARLTLVGTPLSDTNPVNNRPTLAQTFTAANGEKFSLVVNHLKSKGSCPSAGDSDAAGNLDSGDGQGCWNATRRAQAQRLRDVFVPQVRAAAGSDDVLLVGDMNSYGQEQPITDLTGNGYVDEKLRTAAFAYSYVFDGLAGRLDHALSTAAMSPKITGARAWHINADEQIAYDYNLEFKAPLTTCGGLCPPDPTNPSDPFRSSDHDPLLVGLDLYKTVAATTLRELLSGTAGADRFVFTSVLQGGDSISGFQPGIDQIVVKNILATLGRSAVVDPLNPSQGYITCVATRSGAAVGIDIDGVNGPLPSRALVQLNGLNCASVMNPQNFVVR